MKFVKFVYICVVCMFILGYFFYKSLINYIAQQYHYEISINETDSIFNIANNVTNEIEKYRILLLEKDAQLDSNNIESSSEVALESSLESNNVIEEKLDISQVSIENSAETLEDSKADSIDSTIESNNLDSKKVSNINTFETKNTIKHWEIKNDKLYIQKGANFLLIGDSLMQGIGFALNKDLRNAGFKVKNIAKQSTGIVYLKSFNWIKETKNAFKQNPKIAVLVVCLGMNDGWDIWDSGNHKFGSSGWIDVYGSRVQEIIDIARSNNAAVMWFEVAAVQKERLNNKMKVLNEIFKEKARENGIIFISSENILQDSKYTKFIKNTEGKSEQVRADDGIHFTKNGAKILSDALFSHLEIIDSNTLDSKENITNIEMQDKDKLIESIINRNKNLQQDSNKEIDSNKETKNIESKQHLEQNNDKNAIKNHPFFNNIE